MKIFVRYDIFEYSLDTYQKVSFLVNYVSSVIVGHGLLQSSFIYESIEDIGLASANSKLIR